MNRFFTVLLIMSNSIIFAQDQIAKDILDKLSNTTKAYKNMTLEFEFILENKSQNIQEKQKGTLISENNNFKLMMDGQTIINNGESQWVYLRDMNEVTISEYDPEDQMMNLNNIFTIYEEGYKYNYIEQKKINLSGRRTLLDIIDLFPKESGPFIKITLAINKSLNQLYKIKIHDKNGGTYTYIITSFSFNNKIEPLIFNKSKYPDVEVIDLR